MTEFERLKDVIAQLRSENGCPWDREQTHKSLKRYCIEEAAEVVAGVDILESTGDGANLCEELGDLLLQIVLQAQIAQEEGLFTIEDVSRGIADKMIRRHPHVFSDEILPDNEAINARWDEIKRQEKAGKEWMEAYLPKAFEESEEYIRAARERKKMKAASQQYKKIYFDMDGVLADFDRGVSELLGLEPIEQGHHTARQDDIMFAHMSEYGHFYRDLKPLPGAVELFKKVYAAHPDKVAILSGIPKASRGVVHAEQDKRDWIKEYFGEDVEVNICLRADKPKFCTGPECILIDDFIKNVHEWEAVGGTGILHTGMSDTLEKLNKLGL